MSILMMNFFFDLDMVLFESTLQCYAPNITALVITGLSLPSLLTSLRNHPGEDFLSALECIHVDGVVDGMEEFLSFVQVRACNLRELHITSIHLTNK